MPFGSPSWKYGETAFYERLWFIFCRVLRQNGEFLATFSATSGEYATTVSGQHALTETMLVVSLSVVGLECSFHCDMLFLIFYCSALCRSGDSAARYSGCKFR